MEHEKNTPKRTAGGDESGRDIPVTDLNEEEQAAENSSPEEQAMESPDPIDEQQCDPEGDAKDPLNEALMQAASHKEAVLRAHAEMENLRKRSEREIAQARKFALERIMQDLLPVIDSLERGLEVEVEDAGEGVEKLREGGKLTLKLLLKAMADHGMQIVDPAGEKFDPERHEAVGTEAAGNGEPSNTVLKVWQKGYVLNDRLLRPAMVVVSS